MLRFSYNALTSDGREVSGYIEASSSAQALNDLQGQGLSPFTISETAETGEKWWNRDILSRSTVSAHERVTIARELATYINAGVPLIDALSAIKETLGDRPITRKFSDVITDVERGEALSASFRQRGIFEHNHIGAIEASEASGKLGLVFNHLANFLELSKSRKSELISALFYPIILLVMAFGAVLFISTSLLPSLAPIFEDSGKPLPFTANLLLNYGILIKQNWALCLLGAGALIGMIIYIWKLDALKPQRDLALLKLPLVGRLIRDVETAQFNRSLGLMLTNGVTLVEGIRVAETSLTNFHFKEASLSIINKIEDGDGFAAAYANSELFSPISVRMVTLGDKSGTLAEMVVKTGQILDIQIKRQIDRAIAIMTPALTLITGIIIGGVVISVLSAILSVNDLVF